MFLESMRLGCGAISELRRFIEGALDTIESETMMNVISEAFASWRHLSATMRDRRVLPPAAPSEEIA
jgi:hypothetical protein